MGSALMGSLQISCFLHRGTFWVLPLTYFLSSAKCQDIPFSPICQNSLFAAAPLVSTPFVRNQVLLRGVGTPRFAFSPPSASAQRQPDGLTIRAEKWFLGAGFLGAPPISLIVVCPIHVVQRRIVRTSTNDLD